MILILSKSKNETTTDQVIDWLNYYKESFYRLNGDDLVDENYKIEFGTNTSDKFSSEILSKLNSADVIWFRRWYETVDIKYFNNISPKGAVHYQAHIRGEINNLSGFIFQHFKNRKWFDYYPNITVNKMMVTELAIAEGINVPDTLITNNKNDVISFECVTKSG